MEALLVEAAEVREPVQEPVEEERRRPESDQMPAISPAKASRPLHAVPDYAVRGDRAPREDLLKSDAAKRTRVVKSKEFLGRLKTGAHAAPIPTR